MDSQQTGQEAAKANPPALKLKAGTKRAGVLRSLLDRGRSGLNCFEAVRLCHDYVLRSTISDLRREYGFTFSRKWEKIPGHGGSRVDCVRYWLSPEDEARARDLLEVCP